MPVVLPSPFNIIFIFIEPLLTFLGAYSAFAQPEWYLASQIPGETDSGLLHTIETTMAIRLYGVLLTLLPLISLAVLPAIASKSDQLSWTIARRFFFVLAVGDIVHIVVAAVHIGEEKVKDVSGWNDMTWGNIGITVFLLVSRISWFVWVWILKTREDRLKKAF